MQHTHYLRRRDCRKKTISFLISKFFIMKKIIFISLSVLIISFLASCKKEVVNPYEGRVVAEGYVRQMGLKKGIVPNATVVLYEVRTSGEAFAPTYFISIDTVITDAEGHYSIDKPVSSEHSIFELGASAPNYYNDYFYLGNPTANPLDPNHVGLGKNVKARVDIGLKPYSWVKVHVKKANPNDSTAISITGSWTNSVSDAVYFNDAFVDEIFVRKILGNDSTNLSYNILKGSKYISKETENKFAAGNDTVKFNINY